MRDSEALNCETNSVISSFLVAGAVTNAVLLPFVAPEGIANIALFLSEGKNYLEDDDWYSVGVAISVLYALAILAFACYTAEAAKKRNDDGASSFSESTFYQYQKNVSRAVLVPYVAAILGAVSMALADMSQGSDIVYSLTRSPAHNGGEVGLVIGMAIVTLVAGSLAIYNVTKNSSRRQL